MTSSSILRDVLESDHLVSAMTSSEDVDTAKPRPDIVKVALDRAGVVAAHAVFIGDAVWDVEACKRAGVVTIALLSGGVSKCELEEAGAHQVFDDALELCQHLDDTPIAAPRQPGGSALEATWGARSLTDELLDQAVGQPVLETA